MCLIPSIKMEFFRLQYLLAVLVTVDAFGAVSQEGRLVVTVEADTIIKPTEDVTWIPFSKVGHY